MYVRDHTRPALHDAMGLNATEYDFAVFKITTEITKQVFPILLDTDHPKFKEGVDELTRLSLAVEVAKEKSGPINALYKGWLALQALIAFGRLYFLPVIKSELPKQVRMVPTW